MHMTRSLVLLAAAMTAAMTTTLALPANAQSPDCLPHTAAVRGELRVINTRHPNGQAIEAMQLVFRPSICIVLPEPDDAGRPQKLDVHEMHIVPQKQFAARLKQSLGKAVTARGEIGEPHTAWHQGDAIMFNAVIVGIEPL
jgi:hypothetical protein